MHIAGSVRVIDGFLVRLPVGLTSIEGPSPRDDLESLVYTIVWLLRGILPWDHCKTRKAEEWKSSITSAVLCNGLPVQFCNFFDYVRHLEYHDEPNYGHWKTTFRDLSHAFGYPSSGAFNSATAGIHCSNIKSGGLAPWSGPVSDRLSNNHTDSDDDEETDSDDDDFLPTRDWPAPQGIEEQCLLGNEEEILKGKVAVITVTPVMAAGLPSDLHYPDNEKMIS
jgi:hypothetical protein